MPLRTSQPPLIPASQAAPGDMRAISNQLRRGSPVLSQALDSIQNQFDLILKTLSSPPPALDDFYVTDQTGKLIFWAGSRAAAGKQYVGIYGAQGYFGGTDPSTAKLVIDSSGNVTLTGATITWIGKGHTYQLDPTNGFLVTSAVGFYTTTLDLGSKVCVFTLVDSHLGNTPSVEIGTVVIADDAHVVWKGAAGTVRHTVTAGGSGDYADFWLVKVQGSQVLTTRQSTPTKTTKTAGATYTANEQAMLNELKAWQNGVDAALSSAAGHGLWT